MENSSVSFCTFLTVSGIISPSGDHTWLVMVFEVQSIPALPIKLVLPLGHHTFQLSEIKRFQRPLAVYRTWDTVDVHMLECEDHVQLFPRRICEKSCNFRCGTWRLTHRHTVIFGKYFLVHLMDKLVKSRSVAVIFSCVILTVISLWVIREGLVFGDGCDYVHTPSVSSFIHPEFHQIIDFLTDSFIFPVDVRLFFAVEMKVILATPFVIFPGASAEAGTPVVWLTAICFRVFPDVIITVFVVF